MAVRLLPPEVAQLFSAGGATGALMRETDWAATRLGDPAVWPQSLRTAIGICLESRFPMLIWWGTDLVKIYNDAYAPILGGKHPRAMGQRGEECWPEIWDTIGPMLAGVLAGDGATYSEDQLLPLVRHGFTEECYFTFSYSPIRDETGGIGGVFTAVTETTGRVIGARRLATLRELAQRMVGAGSPEQLLAEAAAVLNAARRDVPLALICRLGDDRVLSTATAGDLQPDEFAIVEQAVRPVLTVAAPDGEQVQLNCPVGPDEVRKLMVLPVEAAGVAAALVAGVSPALPLDEDYHSFLRLVAGQIATALAEAVGHQTERARAEALAALDQAKTAFFANISHEFRTPLTLLLGPTEDALADQADPLTPGQRVRTELVRRNALRLLKLVNTLLDFSRLEAGRSAARYEPVELGRFTSDVASVFRSAVERAGLAFVVDCPPVSELAYVDREMWEKIVLNLLSNALKFTFEGEISVRLKEHADGVVLTVSDTGVGIAPDDQRELFQRFHRVHGIRSRTFEGSGIGLSLVAELAQLHGGSVSVQSAPGKGSAFAVSLPRSWEHLPPDQVHHEPNASAEPTPPLVAGFVEEALRWFAPDDASVLAPSPGPTASTQGRSRLLVVDDNADMRAYVAALLGDELDVEEATDGIDALERIRTRTPDLVLADVMMPRLDGFGLLARVREDPATSHLPVVLLSARAGDEAAAEGLDAGADDYLIKPFTARELHARVRAALSLETLRRERALALAAAAREDAEREQQIADALQRSLLPTQTFVPDYLDVATYYRAGTEGTQVGGDWFDVIELGAGRAALVIGDVMGRGVRAAAVMGQLRAAIRAYARLDLPPADVLELLDGVVRDLGDDQMVTCVYAIYDPADRTVTYANAGHLPPVVGLGAGPPRALTASATAPLGTGAVAPDEETVHLDRGATLVLYTDGLVERRDRDIDTGLRQLVQAVADHAARPLNDLPERLVDQLDIGEQDDDVAVLAVRVHTYEERGDVFTRAVEPGAQDVSRARYDVGRAVETWSLPQQRRADAVLVAGELITNALLHGRPPVELRLRRTPSALVIEVCDGGTFLPRRLRASPEDERGRGLQLVETLADRWGARATSTGKATWCVMRIDPDAVRPGVTDPDGAV